MPGVGAAAYVARNDATSKYAVISIADLAEFAGVDPFSGIPDTARNRAMDLPPPTPRRHEKTAGRQTSLKVLVGMTPTEGEPTEPANVEQTSTSTPNIWRLIRAAGTALR